MSVMLLDVWRAARARSVPFSGESAGYVALGLCEALERDPRAVDLAAVELGTDGALRVVGGEPCSGERAEVIVRGMLGMLLGVASSPGPALFRAAGREPGAGVDALTTELKKALIPVNRAAARRALLRLCRETERAVATGRLAATEELSEPVESSPSALASALVSPPPLPVKPPPAASAVSAVPPAVVAPPALRVVAPELPPPEPAANVARAAAAIALPAFAEPPELEPEQLTSPETVVARIKHRARSTPPPLPPSDRHSSTPRIGSIEAAEVVVKVVRTPSPPPLPLLPDATERAPQVREYSGEPFELCASVIDAVPVVELVTDPREVRSAAVELLFSVDVEAEAVPDAELEDVPDAEFEAVPDAEAEERAIAVALAIAESAESAEINESPALVIGVHVDDSEEAAELVDDDDIETRPLLGRIPPAPYPGLPLRQSNVRDLISGFQVGGGVDEMELRRELKALAGVDLTPAQVSAVRPR